MTRPLSSADLWAGVACLALGALVLWAAADYPLGNAGRIGPGYVPRLLAWLLIGLGGIMLLRSLIRHESMEPGFAIRPVALVLAAVLTFAVAFSWLGLVPAILLTVAVSNFAVPSNTWRSALAVGVVLALFAWALFVKALGLPLPVFIVSSNSIVIPAAAGEPGPRNHDLRCCPWVPALVAASASPLLGRNDSFGARMVTGAAA